MAAAQNPRPETVAIAAEDAEFSRNAADGARNNIKKDGFKIVYDKTYPPNSTDFSPIVRALQASNAELVVVCSYPMAPAADFFKKYQARAPGIGIDPLGYYLGGWGYAYLQVLADAITGSKQRRQTRRLHAQPRVHHHHGRQHKVR
jgi:branched-chain amino acid transport system substrate-binding protein